MVKVSKGEEQQAVKQFQYLHQVTLAEDPIRYRNRKLFNSTSSLAPRKVPSFNSNQDFDIEKATKFRKLLVALAEKGHSTYAPLTSDDFAVLLDSGCSLAMTNDLNDLIDGYQPVNERIGGIAAGLQAMGIGDVC